MFYFSCSPSAASWCTASSPAAWTGAWGRRWGRRWGTTATPPQSTGRPPSWASPGHNGHTGRQRAGRAGGKQITERLLKHWSCSSGLKHQCADSLLDMGLIIRKPLADWWRLCMTSFSSYRAGTCISVHQTIDDTAGFSAEFKSRGVSAEVTHCRKSCRNIDGHETDIQLPSCTVLTGFPSYAICWRNAQRNLYILYEEYK